MNEPNASARSKFSLRGWGSEALPRITMFNELTWPPFLFLGLAARFATLPLLGQLVVMEMTYPMAWNDHVFWASVLLFILTRGPGAFSLDYLIERYLAKRRPAASVARNSLQAMKAAIRDPGTKK